MSQRHIEIRHLEPRDFEAVREIHAQPRAIWGTLQLPYPSSEFWRKRIGEQPDGSINLCACVDGAVVGMLGLVVENRVLRRRHVGELGMAVHDAWQGRGIGSALLRACLELADRWLNLSRIELKVYTDNAPAIRLYERFGFEVEGTLRAYAFRDGCYVDAHAMARLRRPEESLSTPGARAGTASASTGEPD